MAVCVYTPVQFLALYTYIELHVDFGSDATASAPAGIAGDGYLSDFRTEDDLQFRRPIHYLQAVLVSRIPARAFQRVYRGDTCSSWRDNACQRVGGRRRPGIRSFEKKYI